LRRWVLTWTDVRTTRLFSYSRHALVRSPGRIVLGPDYKAMIASCFLIIAPLAVFYALVIPYTVGTSTDFLDRRALVARPDAHAHALARSSGCTHVAGLPGLLHRLDSGTVLHARHDGDAGPRVHPQVVPGRQRAVGIDELISPARPDALTRASLVRSFARSLARSLARQESAQTNLRVSPGERLCHHDQVLCHLLPLPAAAVCALLRVRQLCG